MSGMHEWEDGRDGYKGRRYTVTEAVATFADAGCPPTMLSNHCPLRREILRLVAAQEDLERRLDFHMKDATEVKAKYEALKDDIRGWKAETVARIRRELLADLGPEVRMLRIPGSQTEVECIRCSDFHAALDRACPEPAE